jgi:hypothetical protein
MHPTIHDGKADFNQSARKEQNGTMVREGEDKDGSLRIGNTKICFGMVRHRPSLLSTIVSGLMNRKGLVGRTWHSE